MPPTFFVCYRREDAGYAAALSQALVERHGRDRVFKDITSLQLAHDWRTEVAAAIGRSTHVLALIGPNWMAGVDQQGLRYGRHDPIVFELVEANRSGRAVVPVLLGQRMPPAHRLPVPLRWLSSLHAAHVRVESADADIAALVDGLPQPARRPATPSSRTTPHPASPPRRRGGFGALVAAAVVVAAVVAAFASGAVDTVVGGVRGLLPGAAPALTIDPSVGPAGTTITATATGFSPGVTVRFYFAADAVRDEVADGEGRVTATFAVPDLYGNFPGTTHPVRAVEENSATSDSALFTVTG